MCIYEYICVCMCVCKFSWHSNCIYPPICTSIQYYFDSKNLNFRIDYCSPSKFALFQNWRFLCSVTSFTLYGSEIVPHQYVKICPLPCHWGIVRSPQKDAQCFISPIPHDEVTHTRCCRQQTLFTRVTSHTWAPEYGDSQKWSGFTLANLALRKAEPVRVPAAVWHVTWWSTQVRFQPVFLSLWESLNGFPESSVPLLFCQLFLGSCFLYYFCL